MYLAATRLSARRFVTPEQYFDLGVGLADASLVALATRLGIVDIATFDERYFRAVRLEKGGSAFRLLPADH